MAALVPLILQALPSVVQGAQHLIAYIQTVRAAGRQSGEWTADHEAQFMDALIARATSPAYQPDKN